MARDFRSERISFFFHPNVARGRTGSLYAANNTSLELADGRYRYISFTQADMQLMFWNQRIIEVCDRLRDRHLDNSGKDLCFYTQIPIRGKRDNFYAIWQTSRGTADRTIPGTVDVGIYPIESELRKHLKFAGTEREFSHHASTVGFSTAMHPFPFLAAIPFPKTLRDRRQTRASSSSQARQEGLLALAPSFKSGLNFDSESFHPMFMEDCVWPSGWSALTPYWPSDTNGTSWIGLRIKHSLRTGQSFLGVQEGGQYRPFPVRRFRPGYPTLLRSLLKFGFREIRLWFMRKTTRR